MKVESVEQRPVHLEDVAQALGLAQPTQRLLACIHKRNERWPGKPIYEKFSVIQEEAKLLDLDFANAIEELLAHGVASFGCSEDSGVSAAHIVHSLRYRFVHGTLDEPRKLNVALIHLHWPEAARAVRAAWNGEPMPHTAPPATVPGARVPDARAKRASAVEAESSTSYRIVFRDGKPIRIEGDEVPPAPEASRAVSTEEPPQAAAKARKDGWVYVLKVGRNYKIGKTINLSQRMTQLRIQLPEKPEVVHTIATNDIDWVERHWHKCFASKRKNGEWFRLMPDDVEELKAIRRMDVER